MATGQEVWVIGQCAKWVDGSDAVVAESVERVELEEVAVLILVAVFVGVAALEECVFKQWFGVADACRIVPVA